MFRRSALRRYRGNICNSKGERGRASSAPSDVEYPGRRLAILQRFGFGGLKWATVRRSDDAVKTLGEDTERTLLRIPPQTRFQLLPRAPQFALTLSDERQQLVQRAVIRHRRGPRPCRII